MLQNLGYDILVGNIFPNLSGADIVNVSLCCKSLKLTVTQLVWRSQYRSTFDMGSTNELLEGDWEKAYAKRINCDIYCWGGNIKPDDVPDYYLATNTRGICRPFRITSQIKTRQIALCGFGLLMLSLDGKIYSFGGFERNRLQFSRNAGRTATCISDEMAQKFDFISAGRTYVIATAGDKLFSLGQGFKAQWTEVPVNDILKVTAGWDVSAAIRLNHGVIYWKNIVGAPGTYISVPDTVGNGTLAAGAGFILFLDEIHRLHFIDARTTEPKKQFILGDEYPVCIRATYCRFAVICESGRTYAGKYEDGEIEINLVAGSQEIEFSDIALGDHHILGLSKSGEVYAWGTESQKCGSLGLGPASEVIEKINIGVEEGGDVHRPRTIDIVVKRPMKVDLEGAISVTAGGWQSAAIVIGND